MTPYYESWKDVWLCATRSSDQKLSSLTVSLTCPGPELPKQAFFGFLSLGQWVDHFLKTSIFDSGLEHLDTSAWTTFQKEIYRNLCQVSWGKTLTYKDLAARSGRPKASRAVGTAMARNLFPLIVPCHRIVPSSGGVGQYAFGADLKRQLLEREKAERCFIPKKSG